MRVNSELGISPSMKKGLYFTKKSNVIYNINPTFQYMTDEIVKVSEEGSRYIEDNLILPSIKERFAKIPFIKELAKKFDTFVFFREIPKGDCCHFNHLTYATIGWADYSKEAAQRKAVMGKSSISQKLATEDMFNNLEKGVFNKNI